MLSIARYIRQLIENSYRTHPKTFAFYSLLRVMVLIVMIRSLIIHNYQSAATCGLVRLLFLLPAFLEDQMNLMIPPLFQSIIFGFIFAAEILGEIDHYYVKIPGWDTILHTINGFLFAAVGFSAVYLLNRGSEYFDLSPLYLSLMAFCVSMTVGVLWEFFECSMDLFFDMDMQKDFVIQQFASVRLDPLNSGEVIQVQGITDTVIHTLSGETFTVENGYLDVGILDTMKDLLVNLIGAVVFSVLGFLTLKDSKPSKVVDSLLIRPKDKPEEKNDALVRDFCEALSYR